MRILIVDDCEDTRSLLRSLLHVSGWPDVREASSAAEAIDMMLDATGPFDLVMTDITMPDRSGIDLCRDIKAREAITDVPVMMVTSRTDSEDLESAFVAGAHDYVTKPFDRVELVARVRAALRLKQQLDIRRDREHLLAEMTSKLEANNTTLRHLSIMDGLTGVANRRAFDDGLAREWRRARRNGSCLSVLIADVDHFKAYNDFLGHQQGDDCLRRVARALLAEAKRPADLLARYGGEEFGVILPDTDDLGAGRVAEAMRARIESLRIRQGHGHSGQVVTVSIGYSMCVPTRGGALEQLITNAHRALYRAKQGGRNRIEYGRLALEIFA